MPYIPQLLAFTLLLAAASPACAAPVFEPPAICRTAIASIMGRDPKLVQTTAGPDGVVLLTYVRPIDNFVWAYRCRLQDNRVIWATDPGRWREDVLDDKIFFEIVGAGAQLRIIEDHVDGTSTRQLYDRNMIE
jgi:hypothetical protein